MVGLVIGLLSVIVVSQILVFAEAQKRSAISGSDAQVNGVLALYNLQREVEMSGYGLVAAQAGLGCTIKSLDFTAGNGGNRILAPVVITAGGAAAPDTLRLFGSSKQSFAVTTTVTADHPASGVGDDTFIVSNNIGITAGDLMIAVPATPSATNTCTVFRANGAMTSTSVQHLSGMPSDTAAWNGAALANLLAIFPAAGYTNGSYLINLGAGLIDRTYSISATGALQLVEFDSTTASNLATRELYPQVVNLQAFYGKDTSGDGAIDAYDKVQPASAVEWSRVVAIRVAVVARSAQFEKEEVTPTAPQWDLGATPAVTGSTPCGSSQCLTLNVNFDMPGSDWKHYRYKVFNTVIPLRNLVWRS